MTKRMLQIRLFGGFSCHWEDGEELHIRGAKHRALIALVATAANGTHSRSWIQEVLWSLSGEELGRASLRRALADLRKVFGSQFNSIFMLSNIDVQIDFGCIELLGDARDGEFLEGITIPEVGFDNWLREKRNAVTGKSRSAHTIAPTGLAPRVAIVPFTPKTADQIEAKFSDLVALEVSRGISRSKMIDVISHLSSRRLVSRQLDLASIQSRLNIDYLVYGSVRLNGRKFRIDADLADAKSGQIIWTRDFEGSLPEFLERSQEEISALCSQIGYGILSASVELAKTRPLPHIESHALLMSAITFMHRHELASFARSRAHLEELINRAPQHATLHSWLAKWYVLSIAQGWSNDTQGDNIRARDCTKRALEIDPNCSFSLAIDGMIQSSGRHDDSLATKRFDNATQIDPNNALAWLMYSRLHMFRGEGELALKYADRASSLSPIDPHGYFFDIMIASAHSVCGNYTEALKFAERSLKANQRHTSSHRVKVIALESMGRGREAAHAASTLVRLEPNLTIKNYLEAHPSGDSPLTRQWSEALKSAGVPVE